MKHFLFIFFILSGHSALAINLQLELGNTDSKFNYFQLPNDPANRVDLPTENGISYRLTGAYDVSPNGKIYFLLAPLTLKYQTTADRDFEFRGGNYLSNTETTVTYKFNSYRVGYLWTFGTETFEYWAGAVAKIRDADIKVTQGDISKNFSNVGFVPLLAAGFHYKPTDIYSLYFHLDGSSAPQGSAYDGVVEARVRIKDGLTAGIGYRVLGGGADNDTLKNFAEFQSTTVSLLLDW